MNVAQWIILALVYTVAAILTTALLPAPGSGL